MRIKNHVSIGINKALFIRKIVYQKKKFGIFSQKGEIVESNESNKRRKFKIKYFYCKKSSHMIKDCKKKIADEKQNK